MPANGHDTLSELVTPYALDKRYALSHGKALSLLKGAKLKPAFSQKLGRGVVMLFKRDDALPVIEKHVAAQNPSSNPTPAKDQMSASARARGVLSDGMPQVRLQGQLRIQRV